MRRYSLFFLVPVLISTLFALDARSDTHTVEPFIGRYIGHSISNLEDNVSARDFDVTIMEGRKGGFKVSWTTFIHKGNGAVKKKASTIAFKRTGRPGVFASAQKKDMFGNHTPYDPMDGDPYVWARISGKKLSVFGLLVTDSGGYEMQVYHRTLTDRGMELEFTRMGEEGLIRRVSGNLQRVGD